MLQTGSAHSSVPASLSGLYIWLQNAN